MGDIVPFQTRDDFKHSDGELPHGCSDVWAISILTRPSRGHFFVANDIGYESLCGVTSARRIFNGQNALFGAGTYPNCKRCMERLRHGR